jgi:hypothetical protein
VITLVQTVSEHNNIFEAPFSIEQDSFLFDGTTELKLPESDIYVSLKSLRICDHINQIPFLIAISSVFETVA